MKRRFIISGIFIFTFVSTFYAQSKEDILFRIGDENISEKEALYILGLPSNAKEKISIEAFNNVLNFYLSIHDFKSRGSDTTKKFKRKLEIQTFNILGNIYSAENYENIINKCTVLRNSYAIVKDLFVPFDPMLLRTIENLRKKPNTSFETITQYATAYEGTYLSTRIIVPSETTWSLNRAACELLEGTKKHTYIGPIKDLKGYHYLQLIREQSNFGRYKTQMIYVADMEGQGERKIKQAYKEVKSGLDFELAVAKYSEAQIENDNLVVYFSPAINTNGIVLEHLNKLKNNGEITEPFFASGAWYVIKRLNKEIYPSKKDLKSQALETARRPSFFMEELKEKYNVREYPYNFLSGRDEILFLVGMQPYYTKDLKTYAKEYGYDFTTETYDRFFNHLLLEEYKKELDTRSYQRLLDDFYFMQIRNPILTYNTGIDKNKFIEDLRRLVTKYKPVIPNKKYVENNPIFKN